MTETQAAPEVRGNNKRVASDCIQVCLQGQAQESDHDKNQRRPEAKGDVLAQIPARQD
jgi:hypothetical protein